MTPTRRALFQGSAAASLIGAAPALASDLVPTGFDQIAKGPFKPNWDSLATGYRTPDWFRDAKFGLWAHWGAQCVPEAGDWYARSMNPLMLRHNLDDLPDAPTKAINLVLRSLAP